MKTPEKAGVKKMAHEYGCEARYSGKERIMYIHGQAEKAAVIAIKNNLNPLFAVVEGNHIYKKLPENSL
jgi:hypothetical protein